MLKICIFCCWILTFSINVFGINKDFSVHDYSRTPIELLKIKTYTSASDRNKHFTEIVSASIPVVLLQAISTAEQKALEVSGNSDEFISNFMYYLGDENSPLYEFYIQNMDDYCKFVKENYDNESYEYYRKEYSDINTFNYILRLYWNDEFVPGVYNVIDSASEASKIDSSLTREEKVLSIITPGFNKFIRKEENSKP